MITDAGKLHIGKIDRDSNNNFVIKNVPPGSSLDKAGVEVGDRVYSILENIQPITIPVTTLYEGLNEGDAVDVVLIRGVDTLPGKINLELRDGWFNGDISISSYPGYFFTLGEVIESYGEKQKILRGNNYAVVGQNLLIVSYEILPKTTDGSLDFEFKRFKKTMINFLNNIKLE